MKYTRNGAEVPRRIERRESEINALIRGMYVSDDTNIQPELTGIDVTESPGYDPYNSGTFDPSKSWESHSRLASIKATVYDSAWGRI